MMTLEITAQRLHNQRLSQTNFKTPNEVVQWLGAVQAQDYAGAKWALAQRMLDASDAMLDQALADGSILRTHLLRPTWHFVSPTDIRWLLKLTAPRVHAASAYMYRSLELDAAIFKKSDAIVEKKLRGGKHLTRAELTSALKQAGISSNNLLRFTYLIGHAELEGLVCSGPRKGRQFTYALLDERVPQTKPPSREEALAELASRYFTSRGPATLQDFVWWSGLTMTDARNGLELVKSKLNQEIINDQTYWFPNLPPRMTNKSRIVYLLPNYDEYLVGYTDRSYVFDTAHINKLDSRGGILFQHTVVINGPVAGTWKRTLKKSEVVIETSPFRAWTKAEEQAIADAAERFGKFLGLPVSLIHKEHTHEQRKTRSL